MPRTKKEPFTSRIFCLFFQAYVGSSTILEEGHLAIAQQGIDEAD
jgi:hypothetical protein